MTILARCNKKIPLSMSRPLYTWLTTLSLNIVVEIRDGNPKQTKFLDPETIRIRNLNCRLGLLICTNFVAFKFFFHSSFHAYFSLG